MAPQLTEIEKKALDIFKSALEKIIGKGLFEMKLFGSKARGDSTVESDIDILVVVESDDWHICNEIYKIATDIQLSNDVCISPKVLSRKDYTRNRDIGTPFVKNIIKEGVSV